MRHQKWFVALLIVGMFGLVGAAAEKPSADYQKAMQELGAFNAGIDKAVADENYDTVAKLALSAKDAFKVAETYWTGKSADAADLAQKGGKAAADLNVMAGIKSKEGAEFSAAGAKEVCAGCHTAHRERMPDGTFQIK